MQIAQIAPLTEAVPPKLYGGTERVISWLTNELVALGHEVVLFASGDSQTSAHLEACWPKALRLDGSVRDPNALHMAMLERVCQRTHDFDLLHFHLDYYPFSLFSRQSTPFVTTLHGRLDLPEHQAVFATFSSIPVISISDAQRRPVPKAGWIRTIHHGLPERLLTPQSVRPAQGASSDPGEGSLERRLGCRFRKLHPRNKRCMAGKITCPRAKTSDNGCHQWHWVGGGRSARRPRREPRHRRSQQNQDTHCVGSHQGGGRERSDGGGIHRRPLLAGLGAQIGRRGTGPLSKAGCARQQCRRDVRNTAADEGRHRTTWAVNHLAPFLLSKLLLHRLKESAPARIITTASQAHQGAHIPFDDLNAEATTDTCRSGSIQEVP
jgi:Glycosyltransferase Family 4